MIEFYYHEVLTQWIFRSPVTHAEIFRINGFDADPLIILDLISKLRERATRSRELEWFDHRHGGAYVYQLELTPDNQRLFNELCQHKKPALAV